MVTHKRRDELRNACWYCHLDKLEQEKADQQREIERLRTIIECAQSVMGKDGSRLEELPAQVIAQDGRVAELEAALRESRENTWHYFECPGARTDRYACTCGKDAFDRAVKTLLPTPDAE